MNTWNFNTGLRRLQTSQNRITDKNEASMRHFGSGHVRNFLAKIANHRQKIALDKNGGSEFDFAGGCFSAVSS